MQALEPSREPPHDGAGTDSDHEGDGAEEGRERERAWALPARQASDQPPTIGERYRNSGPGTRAHPTSAATVASGSGKRPTRGGQRLVGGAEERQVRSQALGQAADRLLLRLRGGVRRWDKLGEDLADDLELWPEWTDTPDEVPKQTRREHDKNETCHDGEVDLQIKASHLGPAVDARSLQSDLSLGLWRTRSPCRGP